MGIRKKLKEMKSILNDEELGVLAKIWIALVVCGFIIGIYITWR